MNTRFIFIFFLFTLSPHSYAQSADSLENKNFDYMLKWGNVPIGGNFADEKSKKKFYNLFMHRGKLLGVKYFLVRDEKDSLLLAFRYAKRGDTINITNSAGTKTFLADKTGWTIVVGYAKDPRHFADDGDLIIDGVGYWFYPTVDP
jgi:hypothetical protein